MESSYGVAGELVESGAHRLQALFPDDQYGMVWYGMV